MKLAVGLLSACTTFKFCLFLHIFSDIFGCTNLLSKILQSEDIDLSEAFAYVDACIEHIQQLRENQSLFDDFITRAKQLAEHCGTESEFQQVRRRQKKRFHDELGVDECLHDANEKFRIEIYYSILDNILLKFNEKFVNNRKLLISFECLYPKQLQSKNDFHDLIDTICQEYGSEGTNDISKSDFMQEYNLFRERFKQAPITVLEMVTVHVKKNCRTVKKKKIEAVPCNSPRRIFNYLYTSNLCNTLQNLYKVYQIFLTLPVSSASAERSFSKLNIIKSFCRSSMGQSRLSNLAILSIENDRSELIDFEKAIDTFVIMKKK
jgi:hypothetical protein